MSYAQAASECPQCGRRKHGYQTEQRTQEDCHYCTAADKDYDADHLRTLLTEQNKFACFALNATRKEKRSFNRGYYRKRHSVELGLSCFVQR